MSVKRNLSCVSRNVPLTLRQKREKKWEDNEADLVVSLRRRDPHAFDYLTSCYRDRLFSCAFAVMLNKEDAEDVLQEAYAKVFLSIDRFKGESSLYTWMFRIVRNVALDAKRRNARRGGDPMEFDESHHMMPLENAGFDPSDNSLEAVLLKERMEQFVAALYSLSDEHRKIVIMREVDGASYDEIAETLHISKGTVMSRLFYARQRLRGALKLREQ